MMMKMMKNEQAYSHMNEHIQTDAERMAYLNGYADALSDLEKYGLKDTKEAISLLFEILAPDTDPRQG